MTFWCVVTASLMMGDVNMAMTLEMLMHFALRKQEEYDILAFQCHRHIYVTYH